MGKSSYSSAFHYISFYFYFEMIFFNNLCILNNAPIFKGIQFDNFEFLISQYILSKEGYQ